MPICKVRAALHGTLIHHIEHGSPLNFDVKLCQHCLRTSETGSTKTRGLTRLRCDASACVMTCYQCTFVYLLLTLNPFTKKHTYIQLRSHLIRYSKSSYSNAWNMLKISYMKGEGKNAWCIPFSLPYLPFNCLLHFFLIQLRSLASTVSICILLHFELTMTHFTV